MEINGVTDAALVESQGLQPHLVFLSEKSGKPAPQQAVEKDQQVKEKALMQMMVEDIQRNLNHLDVSLTFSTYGKNNDQISIVVAEKATGKVIREIPSKELQSLYAKMQELVGMIFDKQA